MSKLTFRGGIKRRKIDEFRSEVFACYHRYRAGVNRGWRFDGRAALIYKGGEPSPSSFLSSIVTSSAKIFCQIVNFSFFVIGVMLSASLSCVA